MTLESSSWKKFRDMSVAWGAKIAKDLPLLHDPSRCLEEGAWDVITMISDLENATRRKPGYPLWHLVTKHGGLENASFER